MSDTANPGKGNAEALQRARAAASAGKYRDVVAALARASKIGQALTVSTLAASAGVSRQFLYSQPDLLEGLRRHTERHPGNDSRGLGLSRAADIANANAVIKKLRDEIRDLNQKLDAGLAAQIELRDEKRLRQLYQQRGLDLDRAIAEIADLNRTVAELRETTRSLEDDLAIERTALRTATGQTENVTDIRFRK